MLGPTMNPILLAENMKLNPAARFELSATSDITALVITINPKIKFKTVNKL